MEEKRERQTKEEGQVEEDGFDWLAGEHGEVKEMDVLRSMVQKLSLELGREQGRRRETGAQLEEAESPSWLTQLGGLVPLLVAYEEELRGVKNARDDLQQMVERDQVRLEEPIEDNTEMATQLREIAMTGPLDPEEFHAMKESARLVLEENQLVREAEAEARRLGGLWDAQEQPFEGALPPMDQRRAMDWLTVAQIQPRSAQRYVGVQARYNF